MLVIIWLIVGGVLMGQDLIRAAAVRAQISQIEKFNTAANTFRGKYGALPGDIKDPDASNFGLQPRGQYAGEGDGNGIIEGISANAPASNAGNFESAGETILFWADLAKAGFIEGSFPGATASTVITGNFYNEDGYSFPSRLPYGKLGNSYVYVFSSNGLNFYGLSGIAVIGPSATYGTWSLSVAQAYAIDAKVDDGLPQSGRVLAAYIYQYGIGWDADTHDGNGLINVSGFNPLNSSYTYAPSGTSCADNGSGNAPLHYSVSQNNGNNVTCGLSFRMQAGD